jgi:P-type Cu+ transporter
MNMNAKDPICGGLVDTVKARHKSEHGGLEYYFCSDACRDKFNERPDQVLRNPPS